MLLYQLKFLTDKGRQFDKDGNMKQWWNNSTIRAFRERAQCIIDQYSMYKIDEVGLYMNGRMTQGENIADNGGLKQSFRVINSLITIHTKLFILNCILGLQKMGERTRTRARPSRFESHSRSIVLPELCTNLVRLDATRRCSD